MESLIATKRWFAMLNPEVKWTLQKKFKCTNPHCAPDPFVSHFRSYPTATKYFCQCGWEAKDIQQDCVIVKS